MNTESHHEIDISGRPEVVDKPTVLAAGGKLFNFAVILQANQKGLLKELITIEEANRKRKKKRSDAEIDLRIFTVLLYCIISNCPAEVDLIVIDRDYDKRSMGKAKKWAVSLAKTQGTFKPVTLIIGKAGKGDAHDVALTTFRGERKAELVITAEEAFDLYRLIK